MDHKPLTYITGPKQWIPAHYHSQYCLKSLPPAKQIVPPEGMSRIILFQTNVIQQVFQVFQKKKKKRCYTRIQSTPKRLIEGM